MSNTPAPRITADQVLDQDNGYDNFVRSLFNRSGDPSKDFAHAVLGIATEIQELRAAKDEPNRLEEGGDLTFYGFALSQVAYDHLGLSPDFRDPLDRAGMFEAEMLANSFGPRHARIDVLLTYLLDEAKRWVGYGKEPKNLRRSILLGHWVIAETFEDCGMTATLERIVKTNVEKLLERYNGVMFDADRAVNRDLTAERTILENAVAA
jgi:hypothetical protein